VKTIFVAGAGRMGAGIAQVAAGAGHEVILHDLTQELADGGLKSIESSLERAAEKGHLEADEAMNARERITATGDLAQAQRADFVLEAIIEDLSVKKDLFGKLDDICGERAIMATNTSSLSVTDIAEATSRPDRVMGIHFMNPVPVMTLVELVRGVKTADETYRAGRDLVQGMGKEPVTVRDYPGFVVNRLLVPMINEAVACLDQGVASAEDIDRAMSLGANHPMGPLALADLIGLDVALAIMRTLHEGFGEDRYRPHPMLIKMVEAGRLGRKSGAGFYEYGG